MESNYYIFVDMEFNRVEECVVLTPHTLIEAVFVCCKKGKHGRFHVIDTFESKVKNRQPLDQYIKNLTGVTEEEMKDAPNLKEFKKSVGKWILPYKQSYQIMAYGNAGYETINFLFSTKRNRYVDVSMVVKQSFGLSKQVSLEKVHHAFYSTYHTVHDAYSDIKATIRVLEEVNKYGQRFEFARKKLRSFIRKNDTMEAIESFKTSSELYQLTKDITLRFERMFCHSENNSVQHIRSAIERFVTANNGKPNSIMVSNYFKTEINNLLDLKEPKKRKSISKGEINKIVDNYTTLIKSSTTQLEVGKDALKRSSDEQLISALYYPLRCSS